MVKFLHEVIDFLIVGIPDPRQEIVDSFFQGVFEGRSKASSLRAAFEHSLKEAVYNLLSWIRDNDDQEVDDLMQELDHLFVHVQS